MHLALLSVVLITSFVCLNTWFIYTYVKYKKIETSGTLVVGEIVDIEYRQGRLIGTRAILMVWVNFGEYSRILKVRPLVRPGEYHIGHKVDLIWLEKYAETALINGQPQWQGMKTVGCMVLSTLMCVSFILAVII